MSRGRNRHNDYDDAYDDEYDDEYEWGDDGFGPWGYVPPGYVRPGDTIDMPADDPDDLEAPEGPAAQQDGPRDRRGAGAAPDGGRYRADFIDVGPLEGDLSGSRYRDLSGTGPGRGHDRDRSHDRRDRHPDDHPHDRGNGPESRRDGRADGRRGDGPRQLGPGSPEPSRDGSGGSGRPPGGPAGGRAEVAVRRTGRAARRSAVALARWLGVAGRWTWTVATHPRTRAAVGMLVRNGIVYPATGGWVLGRRWWEARTNARYERMLRTTEAAGDHERFSDWEQRAEQARERRHRRRMDWLDAPADIVRGLFLAVFVLVVFLIGIGIILAVSKQDIGWVLVPIRAVIDAIAWCVWLVSVLWQPVLVASPWVLLAVCWQVGRTRGPVPAWAAPVATVGHQEIIVTPGGIAAALAHLGIPALTKAIKDGWQVEFSTPPVRVNGRGYQAVFTLPMGVTPAMIADKRDVLARNLHRAPLEVWPADAELAGQVDLWVSDPGTSEKRAPEYPLLRNGTGDVFAGVPCGISQRGDVISLVLVGANVVLGGLMGQGKSNAARIIFAGAALDPLCTLWVFVFAFNGDFDAYAPRLSRYQRGTEDDDIATAVESLRELYEEVGRREARLAAIGAKKVTRQIAERHPDLRPIVALFSECHELFGHEKKGGEAADLAVQTIRRARKTAITLVFDTQSSRADAIPGKIVELVSINGCFAVKAWRVNDGFLGDGSFQAGIRATELRPGRDIGTSLVTGATREQFEIVKWYFLEVDDDTGYDAATDLIARALEAMPTSTRASTGDQEDDPGSRGVAADTATPGRDLLDDIATVLGVRQGRTEKVNASDIAVRLRELAPDWTPYESINGFRVRAYLEGEFGVTLPTTGRRYPVDPDLIRDLLDQRDQHEGTDR